MIYESIMYVLQTQGPCSPGQVLGALLDEYPDMTREAIVVGLDALRRQGRVRIRSNWQIAEAI